MKDSRVRAGTVGVIALLIISATPAAAGQAFDAAAFRLEWQRDQLGNGLQLLLQPDATQNEVVVEFWIHAGSRDETPGRYGLAHFFEHATPYGFRDDPARARTFRETLTGSNARTRRDFTRYYIKSAPGHLEDLLVYVAQRLGAGADDVTVDRVERHRVNVLREITERARVFWAPEMTMAENRGIFGADHPYGHGVYGSVAENRAVRVDDIRRWFRAHVRPEYTTLFVVGNFDPARARALIEREFAGIAGGERPPPEPRWSQPLPQGGRATVTARTELPALSMGWPVSAWGSEDEAALRVLVNVLETRLSKSRPETVADDAFGVELEFFQHAGHLRIIAACTTARDADAVESWMRDSVHALANAPLAPDELDTARALAIAKQRDALSRLGWMGSRIDLLGRGLLFANDPDAYLHGIEALHGLSADDLQAAARRWLLQPGFVVEVIAGEPGSGP